MSGKAKLSSPLAHVIARYLDLKTALGRRYETERAVLRALDRFLLEDGAEDLTVDNFLRWTRTHEHLRSGVRRNRMCRPA